ncbi:MAG TPA: FCD domain-containing protein [Dehalococcoidia bacterium]
MEQTRPVRRVTLSGQVADELRRLALSGAIPVGGALPSEAELGRRFGCSRGAVREALRGLEQMGIVRRAPNGRQLVVASITSDKFSESFQLFVHLSEVSYGELFEFLEGTERWAAELAAVSRQEEPLARLAALREKRIDSLDALVEVEEEFHDILAETTGNRLLVVARKPLRAVLHDAIAAMVPLMGPTAISGTVRAHGEIIKAIKAGDSEAAGNWAYRHAHAFREALALLGKTESEPARHLSGEANGGNVFSSMDVRP